MVSRRHDLQLVLPLALSAVACVLLSFWFIFNWGGDSVVRVVSPVSTAGLSIYATVCSSLAARSAQGRRRKAWTTMTFALASSAVGGLIRAYEQVILHRYPALSVADVFFLGFVALLCVALFQFPPGMAQRPLLRLLIDAFIVAMSLFLLLWAFGLDRVHTGLGGDTARLGAILGYPILAVIVVTVAVLAIGRSGLGSSVVVWLLGLAVMLMTLSGLVFAMVAGADRQAPGYPSSIGWASSLACFGAAALLSRLPRQPALPIDLAQPRTSVWLPYAPLLIAGTVGPALVLTGLLRVGVPLLMAVVWARQVLAALENRQLLAAAADQALRDPLTGLANRTLFQDRLAHAMMLRTRDDGAVAVLSLDLDDFKLINDTLGHPAADALLVRVGERIADCVRPGDTVARLGGDEFVVLLEGRVDHSQRVSERVAGAFSRPFVIDGREVLVRPSIGMAVATSPDTDLTPDDLVKRSDVAMYAAKRARDSAVHLFSADMMALGPNVVKLTNGFHGHPASSGAAQMQLLGELRRAVDRGALDVVYQVKVELATGRVAGVEALLRWQHPRLGTLRPAAFLPLVQRNGMMRRVTDLVISKVLADAARWAATGEPVPVAVNLFAPLLHDVQLPERLRTALEQHQLPPGMLTVEVTEDLMLDEVDQVTEVLNLLRQKGIRVSIDDFGSGYSALSYLRDLPVDELKLDRHFIAAVSGDPRAAAVVSAMIDLTHDLGISVVAEGVEDCETAAWLRERGCDIGQGYYFGAPVAAVKIPDLVAAEPAY